MTTGPPCFPSKHNLPVSVVWPGPFYYDSEKALNSIQLRLCQLQQAQVSPHARRWTHMFYSTANTDSPARPVRTETQILMTQLCLLRGIKGWSNSAGCFIAPASVYGTPLRPPHKCLYSYTERNFESLLASMLSCWHCEGQERSISFCNPGVVHFPC